MTPPSRSELIAHMVRTGIAGHVDTPRQGNLRHYRRLAERDPYHMFGLTFAREWAYPDILALMAKRCGVVADPAHESGVDTIDPDLTADALEALAERMARAARDRERVMVATGHPVNLHATYRGFKRALERSGCPVVTAGEGFSYATDSGHLPGERVLVWRDGVGMVTDTEGEPRHSHHPFAMEAALEDLRRRGEPWPQLVIADHGFAGAAGEAGVSAVGFADCNDPALFLAEDEGKLHATVPLDDGYSTEDYRPLSAYVLYKAGLEDR
ncbi:phosphatase [Nocardiopsis baichengensis]|uniref:phosphatase n=1 Tax=Nocardiopsis baichengensis TaxID=280240 RepID=UPI000346F273|nr:phosphatase [Nocardiopsis baichengensis]